MFKKCFEATATFAQPENFSTFQNHIDPDWIKIILDSSGAATLRRRRLPAEQVLFEPTRISFIMSMRFIQGI